MRSTRTPRPSYSCRSAAGTDLLMVDVLDGPGAGAAQKTDCFRARSRCERAADPFRISRSAAAARRHAPCGCAPDGTRRLPPPGSWPGCTHAAAAPAARPCAACRRCAGSAVAALAASHWRAAECTALREILRAAEICLQLSSCAAFIVCSTIRARAHPIGAR